MSRNTSNESIAQEEAKVTSMALGELVRRIMKYLLRYKTFLVSTVLMVLAFVVVGRALPLLFGYAIDEGIKKNQLDVIYRVALIYLALEITRSILSFATNYFMQKLGNKALFHLREDLIAHVQRLPIRFYDKNPSGRTVTRLTNDVASLGELFSSVFTTLFVSTLEIISILFALSVLSLKLTALTILVTPFVFWMGLTISKRIRSVFKDAKRVLSQINSFTAECINGIKILRLFNELGSSQRHFSNLCESYRDMQMASVKLFALMWPLLQFFNVSVVCTALFFGAYFRQDMSLTVGSLTAFILLLQSFFRPLRTILERYTQMQNSLASADRVFALMDQKAESYEGLSLPSTQTGEIEFKNLTFGYESSAEPILKNVNLRIPKGHSVALVGRTGSGKSSMIRLVQKLYLYEQGDILLDGTPLSELSVESVRARIGVVQQDNFVFKGTVASNIRLDNPQITDEQVQRAAELTGCLELFERRREGLKTRVEEGGLNLSAGERQLIAFARVLAFDPDIFILDEATASIDSESELKIQQATEVITENRTSIIIAHRLSTIQHCNQIVVLSQGEILEKGSHANLLDQTSAYKDLYNSQFEHL